MEEGDGENMNWNDIRQMTVANYNIHSSWDYLEDWFKSHEKLGLELNPEFQRGHVWTRKQQTKYIEWCLMSGKSGREILFNCKGWMKNWEGPLILVDGLQRVTAVRKYMSNKIKAFGYYKKDVEGVYPRSDCYFNLYVNDLSDYNDVLQWYIDINSGGTPHKKTEIDKVKEMIKDG